ncbi:MAG: D-alanyl-D-alanine carboxypeptidase family protein [Bacillota bacterium]
MKKIIVILLVFILVFVQFPNQLSYANELPPEISAPSAILIDAATGEILYEKDAHALMYPASTTKIMTAILTLENTKLEDIVIIDKDTPFTDGNRIYAIEGEEFTVEQLLYALLVESANDAAVALAKHISGSVEEFAKLMNKRAKELGAKNTHFTNPNGLPDENHLTTAYDLAVMGKYAMTLPGFPEFVKTVRYQIPPTNKQPETRYLKSSNRLLWGTGSRNRIELNGQWVDIKYDFIEGIKTGYTVQAQQCLVSAAKKDGHRLIAVVLKAQGTNIYVDTRKLLDYGFNQFQFVKIGQKGQIIESISVENGEEKSLNLIAQDDYYKPIPIDTQLENITTKIALKENNLRAPISKGEVLGKVKYYAGSTFLGEDNLLAAESIEEKVGFTAIYDFGDSVLQKIINIILSLIILFLIWRTYVTIIRIKKRKRNQLKKVSTLHKSNNSYLNHVFHYDKRRS